MKRRTLPARLGGDVVRARRFPTAMILVAGILAGAESPHARGESLGTGLSYPVDSGWTALYTQVEEIVERGDWDQAVEACLRLAEDLRELEASRRGQTGSGVYPICVTTGGGYATGPWRAFGRLLGLLPDQARKRLGDLLDPVLRERWVQAEGPAWSAGRVELRHHILRDHPGSTVALEAAREELNVGLEEGRVDGARRACQVVLSHPDSRTTDRLRARWISVYLAELEGDEVAWRRETAGLESALRSTPPESISDGLRERLRLRLERPFAPPRSADSGRVSSPLRLPEGDEEPTEGRFELGSVQLRRPFEYSELRSHLDSHVPPRYPHISPVSVREQDATAEPSRGTEEKPAPDTSITLPFFPIARDNRLILQTYGEVVAYELPSLGELWSAPLEEGSFEAMGTLRSPALAVDRVVVSTGDTLTALDLESGEVLWKRPVAYSRLTKGLLADPADFGDVRGVVAPEGEEDPGGGTPILPVTLTPAAVYQRSFIVGASVRVDREILVYLLSFLADGTLAWSSYLGSVQGSDYLGMGSTLSPPLVVEGRGFLLTNMGYVASVDASDGEILWLQAYSRLSAPGKVQSIRQRHRWEPNPILHARGDRIFVAPQDADTLIGLDTETGRLRARWPRGHHTSLLGMYRDTMLLGGPVVTAISGVPETFGTVMWSWTPPGDRFVSLGRAAVRGNHVLVSDLNALYTIDIESGKEISVALWDFRGGGGNILPLRSGHLAVASAGGFLVYNHRERERERLAVLAPEIRLLQKAKLELKGGEIERGLETLREWVNAYGADAPPNSPADRNIFEISEALRYSIDVHGEDHPLAPDLLELLMKTERLRRDRAVAAFRAAQIYLKREQYEDSVRVVRDALAADLGDEPCAVDDTLAIPGRVVAEGILEELRRSGDAGQRAFTRLEWVAQGELARARRAGTQTAFMEVIGKFPLTRACGIAQLELANYFQEQQNLDASLRWLIQYLRSFPEAQNYVEVALRAADHTARVGKYEDARDILITLGKRYPDRPVPAPFRNAAVERVSEYVERRLRDPGFQDIDLPLVGRWLRFPVRLLWRAPANLLTSNRTILEPAGARPESLAGCFLDHSTDLIECRDVETGLPRWTVQFAMVPTMKVPKQTYFRRARSTSARYQGDVLLYRDASNVLGIDASKGVVRWHFPLERSDAAEDRDGTEDLLLTLPSLQERILEMTSTQDGVFLRTSQGRLHALDLAGQELWSRDIDLAASRSSAGAQGGRARRLLGATSRELHGPLVVGDRLAIVLSPALELVYHSPLTGEVVGRRAVDTGEDLGGPLVQEPLVLAGRRAILVESGRITLVDLDDGRVLWSRAAKRDEYRRVWTFPAYPDQLILSYRRNRRQPVLAGLSISRGEPIWEFDRIEAKRTGQLSVNCDDNRLYVIHGEERRRLKAIEVRPGPERDRFTALEMWPNEIILSTFYLFGEEPNLVITQDSLVYHDPGQSSLSVYDKFQGVHRHVLTDPINRFLIDKRRFECQTVDGVLVFLTDRGDAGFNSTHDRLDLDSEREKIDRLRRYLTNPRDWDNVLWLAMNFFREQNNKAAHHILNRALLSEYLPSLDSPGMYQKLRYVLDGIKEEAMKARQPEIITRRTRIPPAIDGELNEAWNLSHRLVLRDLTAINAIPIPGQEDDLWKGEEDLSATLYTGWDERYFYFALDVEDNRIFPYDKEADNWKGDCLIIGLDPSGDGGLHHRNNDQLLTLALTIPNRRPKDAEDEDDQNDGENGEDAEDANRPKGKYAVNKKEDNSGVIYEVAIPWSSFSEEYSGGAGPVPGKRFGLSLVVTDDDTGQGATKVLSLNPSHLIPREQSAQAIWKHLIPEYFPKVLLE